jgi:hypothetical protein
LLASNQIDPNHLTAKDDAADDAAAATRVIFPATATRGF